MVVLHLLDLDELHSLRSSLVVLRDIENAIFGLKTVLGLFLAKLFFWVVWALSIVI